MHMEVPDVASALSETSGVQQTTPGTDTRTGHARNAREHDAVCALREGRHSRRVVESRDLHCGCVQNAEAVEIKEFDTIACTGANRKRGVERPGERSQHRCTRMQLSTSVKKPTFYKYYEQTTEGDDREVQPCAISYCVKGLDTKEAQRIVE